jgi:hypothetical protein
VLVGCMSLHLRIFVNFLCIRAFFPPVSLSAAKILEHLRNHIQQHPRSTPFSLLRITQADVDNAVMGDPAQLNVLQDEVDELTQKLASVTAAQQPRHPRMGFLLSRPGRLRADRRHPSQS